MTDQPDLLDWTPPAVQSSSTSLAAADAIKPSSGTLRLRVLAWLRANGPATDEEMQAALAMNPSTQRPRRLELVTAGFVRDSGKEGVTKSGRRCVLWEVTR